MSALPRPDLPPGPHRDLVAALHELHHQAGWPSLRRLAAATGVSHTTISKTFSQPALPSWGTLELLVEAMQGNGREFHALWLSASSPTLEPPAPRIAGRRAELDVVRRHLDTGAGLLLVTGEAGIGKTTVLQTGAAAADTSVVTGRCFPLSESTPLMPLVDALRALLEMDHGRVLEAALGNCPPYVPGEVARLLPELDAPAPGEPRGEWSRQRLFGALHSLLRGLATHARVGLVLEDVHWADSNTLDLLEHLVGNAGGVPLVASWRVADPTTTPASTEWFNRVRRHPAVTEMTLSPLTREETSELLGRIAPDMDPDAVYARSRGHPLFTAQLAAHGRNDELPALLADLLDARLGDLDGAAWRVARALGVADRPLDTDLLRQVAGGSSDATRAGLRTLAERGLLDRTIPDIAALAHPLLAEAVRRRLLPGEGTEQHRVLAEAFGRSGAVEPAEVALHWRRAGDPQRELGWRIAAARAAQARFDRRAEGDHYLRAIEIWPGSGTSVDEPHVTLAEVYLNAMDALRFTFRFDEAAALSAEGEERFGNVDDGVRADLLLRRSIFRGEVEGTDVGMELLNEALALCDVLPVRDTKVRALDRKQNILFALGRTEEARAVAAEQVEAATELGDPVLLRDALMRMAWHRGMAGHPSEAMDLLTVAAVRSGDHTDPFGDVRQGVYATDVLLACGASADEVAAAGQKSLAVARAYELDNPQIMLVRVNIATALLRDGRVADAELLVDTPPSTPLEIDRWPVHSIVATIECRHGRPEVALQRFEAIWAALSDGAALNLELLTETGDVACWAGRPAPALRRLLEALHVVAGTSPLRAVAPALLMAARAATHQGDVQQAGPLRALARRAGLLDHRHVDDAHLSAHRAMFEADLAHLEGMDSIDIWVAAAAHWDGLSRPHDAAYCRWRAAQLALRDGQGTIAARLLKRAATDAREHVPLSHAIDATVATAS